MRTRLFALLTAALVGGMLALTAAPASAAPPATSAVTVPVTGTTGSGGTFAGVFDIQRFVVQNGTLQAVGTLTGTLTDAAGGTVGTVNTQQALPVDLQQSTGSCEILDLVLGPLDLNLLGLQVHLDTVHLNITAQQAPGNLLGNLLCAVANLLNGPSPLGGLAGLLNRILGVLQGL